MTAGDLAYRSGLVQRTRSRAVAEGFGSVASCTQIPLINNHLDRHLASPHAAAAVVLVCSRCKPRMTALPVDWKRRWNAAPRGWLCLFLNLTCGDFQIADLIRFNGLKTRIADEQRIPACRVAGPETAFGASVLPHSEEKISGLTSDPATNP